MFKLKIKNKYTEYWYKHNWLEKSDLIKGHVIRIKDEEGAYLVTEIFERLPGVYGTLIQKMFPYAKNAKDREPFQMKEGAEYRIIGQQ